MTVLDGILDGVREDLAQRQSEVSLAELKARVAAVAPALDPMPASGPQRRWLELLLSRRSLAGREVRRG